MGQVSLRARRRSWTSIRSSIAVLVLACMLGAGDSLATSATPEPAPTPTPTPMIDCGQFGRVGVVVDDGLGYGDSKAAAQTPAAIVRALMATGCFSSAALNSFELPQQLRIRINAKVSGSEDAAIGKALLGAATLFLLPMKQSYDITVEFEMECRGHLMGNWAVTQTLVETQFLLADSGSGRPGLMQAAVNRFVQQATESGKLAGGCA